MRRLFALALGLGAGVYVGAWVVRRLDEVKRAMTPASMAGRAARGAARVGELASQRLEQRIADARAYADEYEAQMRERFDVPHVSRD